MPQCKYCRQKYTVELWYRREEHAYSVCPDCAAKLAQMKDWGNTALDLGKKAGKAVMSFLEERKRRQKEPSCKPRIRSTNDEGFDDIMGLTDVQWLILSDRQFRVVYNRASEKGVPARVLVRVQEGYAMRSRDPETMKCLGDWYRQGIDGQLDRDYAVAFAWYKKAADLYNADAMYRLADFYRYGRGVKKNVKKAVQYYRQAANKGHPDACFELGECLSEYGSPCEDLREALKWYLKAAELGRADAYEQAGSLYCDGEGGVEQNYEEAVRMLTIAAEKGFSFSQYLLGELYCDGLGVKKDLKMGKYYLSLAASHYCDFAKEALKKRFDIEV